MPVTRKISIVDDDDSMRTSLMDLVRALGYDARGFASAEDFLAHGDAESFACMITDIQMPGMSGIDLKEHLTAQQCSLPVIMITARLEPGLEEKAFASGAMCFLKKPIESEILLGCLERALNS
jgi:FixJ family two-component response regulator